MMGNSHFELSHHHFTTVRAYIRYQLSDALSNLEFVGTISSRYGTVFRAVFRPKETGPALNSTYRPIVTATETSNRRHVMNDSQEASTGGDG
jgi:hypothetical protein